MGEFEILEELDNVLLCDVCKRGYFIFTRSSFMGMSVINIDCSHCYECKSTVSEKNFAAWCEQFHPELLARYKASMTLRSVL